MATTPGSPERIALQVGEKTFHTTKATLAESSVLTNLVSLPPPPPDGLYFLDADPALFEHILRYLRTGLFPLLFSAEAGHDVCLYFALLHEARFYQVARLQTWLENRGYLEAVERRTWSRSMTLYGEEQIQHLDELTHQKHESIRILSAEESVKKCYPCPRRIWKHMGRKGTCVQDGCISGLMSRTVPEVDMKVLMVEYTVSVVQLTEDRALAVEEESADPPPYQAS